MVYIYYAVCIGYFIVWATSVKWTMSFDQYLVKFQESALCSHIYIWLIKPIPLFNLFFFNYRITLSTDLDLLLFSPNRIYQNPVILRAATKAFWTSCHVISKLLWFACAAWRKIPMLGFFVVFVVVLARCSTRCNINAIHFMTTD